MLKTTPGAGTYYPPKVMCEGLWRYMVTVEDWHNAEHDAREAHRYREALEKIAFMTRDWAPTLESCKSIAVEALKG